MIPEHESEKQLDAAASAADVPAEHSTDENIKQSETTADEGQMPLSAAAVCAPVSEEESPPEEDAETDAQKCCKRKHFMKIAENVLSLLLMLGSIGLVLYYIWGAARYEFHSDSTDTLYWAEAAMQGKGLINPDFKYAALMPLGGNLFMQLWIPFFGVTMLTHTLGMTTFLVLFVLGLLWLLHEMKWNLPWSSAAVGCLLMTLSSSEKMREIFWGHIIYYSLGILFLLYGLSMVLRIYNLIERRQTGWIRTQTIAFSLLLLVFFIFCCTNSTMAIALFALPIVAALFCERFLDHTATLDDKKTFPCVTMLSLCAAGIVGGMMLGEVLTGGMEANYANAYSQFSEQETWWAHVEKLPLDYLRLFGLDVDDRQFLMSAYGINTIILLVTAILIVILPIAALLHYWKIKETGLRMLIWSHFTITAFILIGYICGELNKANWRLSPLIATGTLVSIAYLRYLWQGKVTQRLGILLMIPVVYFSVMNACNLALMPMDAYLKNTHYQIAEYLKSKGLDYGYATFWNAQAITIQSDSACKVRSVEIDEDGVSQSYYQSNRNWFEDQPGQEEYFLLMTQKEARVLETSYSRFLYAAHEELRYGGYVIWVFEENLF